MWPESVTFSPKSIKFSEDLYKWWRNSYTKFGAAARRRFFAILKKPQGGGGGYPPPPPPPVRGLIYTLSVGFDKQCRNQSIAHTLAVQEI